MPGMSGRLAPEQVVSLKPESVVTLVRNTQADGALLVRLICTNIISRARCNFKYGFVIQITVSSVTDVQDRVTGFNERKAISLFEPCNSRG